MAAGVGMCGRVPMHRAVTTARLAALLAGAQVHPAQSDGHALDALVLGGRLDVGDGSEVLAMASLIAVSFRSGLQRVRQRHGRAALQGGTRELELVVGRELAVVDQSVLARRKPQRAHEHVQLQPRL